MSDWLEELTAPAPATAGWFGKLVSVGDFAHRRLPAPCVERLDQWLSESLKTSQQSLGDKWLDVYLSCPLWQFLLGADVLDSRPWAGVMMPSCDSVGRYFPLTVLRPLTAPPATEAALAALDQWHRFICETALDTLRMAIPLEEFDHRLASAPALPVDESVTDVTGAAGDLYWSVPGEASTTHVWQSFSRVAAQRQFAGHSLWWPYLADEQTPAFTTVRCELALPAPERFEQILRGPSDFSRMSTEVDPL